MVALRSFFASLIVSCSEKEEEELYEMLSPVISRSTEQGIEGMALGCYSGWEDGGRLLFMDCTSDFGYSNFPWEGYKDLGNGSMTAFNSGTNFYEYGTIRRCNSFLRKVVDVPFVDEAKKRSLMAQIRVIRAYRYFVMNWLYGGVPILSDSDPTDEAFLFRSSEQEVRQFIKEELEASIPDLKKKAVRRGQITQGAALALKMREALYYGDWLTAKEAAEEIIASAVYELEPNYSRLFQVDGQTAYLDSPGTRCGICR